MKNLLIGALSLFTVSAFAFEGTYNSLNDCNFETQSFFCTFSTTTGLTSSSVVGTISDPLMWLKEEIRQVQPDAYNFLAGEEKSYALDDVMMKIRTEMKELENASDEELATLMVK